MNQKPSRQPFDLKRPDAQAIRDQIVHGAYVTEGTMIAFPPCFPGMSVPPPADECRITAMDTTPAGILYAATSGRACHLFVGMFHGVTGVMFDMGVVPRATHGVGVCCGATQFLAAANGPSGGTLVRRQLERLPFDLIQEFGYVRRAIEPVDLPLDGEPIVHLIADEWRQAALVLTPTRLMRVQFDTWTSHVEADVAGRGRMGRLAGAIYGFDGRQHLWRYDTATRRIQHRAIVLPQGEWQGPKRYWAADQQNNRLYLADDAGRLFTSADGGPVSGPIATVPVAPVGPMAMTFDGRLFGTYGEGMEKLFTYEPDTGRFESLGVAVSVLERRRYGYQWGDAVVGRDAEIIFGEDDDLGHAWLYFPKIRPKP